MTAHRFYVFLGLLAILTITVALLPGWAQILVCVMPAYVAWVWPRSGPALRIRIAAQLRRLIIATWTMIILALLAPYLSTIITGCG